MNDSRWCFSGLFRKEGLTTETQVEERQHIQTSVAESIAREFEIGMAECVIRPDALITLGIAGVPYPTRLEDMWHRLRLVGRECALVSSGVYRVRPMERATFRK